MALGVDPFPKVDLLEDLWDELKRGRVYEVSLRSDKWILDGLQQGEAVYIDPRHAILETLLHELLHRRKPRWTEKSVTRMARVLAGGMDEREKIKWWKAYSRIKRKGKPVEVND